MISSTAALIAAFLFVSTADEPAVTVQLGQPGMLVGHVIALFRGSSAPDPATALANWKRATKGKGSLGKAAEAAIAAFNPAMVRELAVLDRSDFVLDFDEAGKPHWSLAVPKDDGTFAAFATAMALTDGGSEPALGSAAVDRLGKPGSPLMAREGDLVVIADTRESLAGGLARRHGPNLGAFGDGFPSVEFSGAGLSRSSRLDVRRAAELIRGLGAKGYSIRTVAEPQPTIYGACIMPAAPPRARLDPGWLADVPAGSSSVVSLAVDPRAGTWNRLFALADRIEKVDPAAANRAPIRARVGLTCRLAGLDLEADVLPKLRGVTGFVIGEARRPQSAALALHMIDDESAATIRDRVLPRVGRVLGLGRATGPLPKIVGARPLGELFGDVVWVSAGAKSTVWIGWGEDAVPSRLAERTPRWLDGLPIAERHLVAESAAVGWLLPSRLRPLDDRAPLSKAIEQTGPIRWISRDTPHSYSDMITFSGFADGVRRFLELIPQEPVPAATK
jgi:hypothetical protein